MITNLILATVLIALICYSIYLSSLYDSMNREIDEFYSELIALQKSHNNNAKILDGFIEHTNDRLAKVEKVASTDYAMLYDKLSKLENDRKEEKDV